MRSHTVSEWLMQYSAVDIEYIQYICNIMWEPEGFEKVIVYMDVFDFPPSEQNESTL